MILKLTHSSGLEQHAFEILDNSSSNFNKIGPFFKYLSEA